MAKDNRDMPAQPGGMNDDEKSIGMGEDVRGIADESDEDFDDTEEGDEEEEEDEGSF